TALFRSRSSLLLSRLTPLRDITLAAAGSDASGPMVIGGLLITCPAAPGDRISDGARRRSRPGRGLGSGSPMSILSYRSAQDTTPTTPSNLSTMATALILRSTI